MVQSDLCTYNGFYYVNWGVLLDGIVWVCMYVESFNDGTRFGLKE